MVPANVPAGDWTPPAAGGRGRGRGRGVQTRIGQSVERADGIAHVVKPLPLLEGAVGQLHLFVRERHLGDHLRVFRFGHLGLAQPGQGRGHVAALAELTRLLDQGVGGSLRGVLGHGGRTGRRVVGKVACESATAAAGAGVGAGIDGGAGVSAAVMPGWTVSAKCSGGSATAGRRAASPPRTGKFPSGPVAPPHPRPAAATPPKTSGRSASGEDGLKRGGHGGARTRGGTL